MESLALQTLSSMALQVGSGKGFRRKNQQCDYCKMKGHTRENCYKLVGYPPRKFYGGSSNSEEWRNNGNSEGWRRNANNFDNWRNDESLAANHADAASSSKDTGGQSYNCFSDEQYKQILGLLNRDTKDHHHANMTGIVTCMMSICPQDE
ncbi:hypothetical protein KY285_002238 [Solanum tuberosum]|nr:hypothetical protein KY289_002506 [Solanum tuberosum]KAH0766367.1 hypothetical protein KY285_002238 [Solanum tuberosum]